MCLPNDSVRDEDLSDPAEIRRIELDEAKREDRTRSRAIRRHGRNYVNEMEEEYGFGCMNEED